ncbi:MAG: hypothetical protein JW807_16365 [Spirochaetes bacterium]|nr:hypothetical protein [Spirochaetota bacterium]
MIKKIWNSLGDIRLSFWLLLAAAVLFFTGMLHSSLDFSYFRAMNEMRIQDWLARELPARPGANWWLLPLLAVLFLLGVNTVICTINRVTALMSGRARTDYRFIVSLFPSAIHILFITVMIGHAVTITTGIWTRVPLAEGAAIRVDPSLPALTVKKIEDSYFPHGSLLSNRIMKTNVSLIGDGGEEILLSYLDSIGYGGYRLHLDMVKDKIPRHRQRLLAQIKKDDETCNRAERFRSAERKRDPSQKLLLLAISDPGLPVILTAFSLILILMIWYFIESFRKRGDNQ